MRLVKGPTLRAYFMEHVAVIPGTRHLYRVVKPLYVFKSAYSAGTHTRRAIVNLVIPVGALVHAREDFANEYSVIDARKMRASKASVHSVAYRSRAYKSAPDSARSTHDYDFYYVPGATVKPTQAFDKGANVCSRGIHFFLNVRDALNWT